MKLYKKLSSLAVVSAIAFSTNSFAATGCSQLLQKVGGYAGFKSAVSSASVTTQANGFPFVGMWAVLMDTDGQVCAVHSVDAAGAANGGANSGNESWLGSRVIAAQKANTANAFSLDAFSIPTGAVFAAVQPGGSLYGLQHSNPVDITTTYKGSANTLGTHSDTLKNKRPGGVNVFGGGIALYEGATPETAVKVGAVGVSGDTSCRDASMAWVLRDNLGFNNPPNDDTLSLEDTVTGLFQQPVCLGTDSATFSGTAGTYGVEYQYVAP